MLDDFQLHEDYAEKIQDKAILEFGDGAYLTGLVTWLKGKVQLPPKEQVHYALRGRRSSYALLTELCRYAELNPDFAIISTSRHAAESASLAPFDINSQIQSKQSHHDIDQLVSKICKKIKFSFESEERHSSTGEFNHTDWIRHNFIDLDLIEVEFLPSQYPAVVNKEDLQNGQQQQDDEYDRLNIRLLHGKRTTAKKLLKESERVFIYGDPGSGKSSYLKWVALKCRSRQLFKEYVPLFLEVRNFPVWGSGQSLKTYFESTFEKWGISQADLAKVISAGRAFYILDGIDEINKSDYQRLEKMIRRLLVDDDHCRFLLSSRLGFNFQFSELKKVIISPFHSRKHIPQFVNNWFDRSDEDKLKANTMLERFKSSKYRGIREIARRPVLLRLLCILFQKNNDFPTRRADVFQQGINVLVQQASQSNLETNISELPELRTNDVTNILCRVASRFFIEMDGDTLFHTREVENIIRNYYAEVYDIHPHKIDAEHILSMIERYNGLLVRWANTFCSFSHLTYQEYFVAQYLVSENKQDTVYGYLENPRWQFITELVAELLPQDKVTDFLEGFKYNIDSFVNRDETVRNFLEELNKASSLAVHASHRPHPFMQVLIRAWYLAYVIGKDTNKIDGALPKPDTYSLPDMFYATSMVNNDILELHGALYDSYHCTSQEEAGRLEIQIRKLIRLFETKDSRRVDTLKSWLSQIDYQVARYGDDREKWWLDKDIRSKWRTRISRLMESLHVPCVACLSREQVAQLKYYYAATHLFSTCINRAIVDIEKRQELANSMLLVEHDPPDKYGSADDFFNI